MLAWRRLQQAVSASRPPPKGFNETVQVGARGFGALLQRARRLDGERMWALEDCRHVSGSLERFRARQRGKSDAIDALAVARAGGFAARAAILRSWFRPATRETLVAWGFEFESRAAEEYAKG